MKTININGHDFQYAVFGLADHITDFYYGHAEKRTFWGGKKTTPCFAFRVSFNIERTGTSKEKLKEYLEKEAAGYVQRCERAREIEVGQLV